MPYSLSHAIVSWPISRLTHNKIPAAPVVIGSISPDFPYLVALKPTYAPGHSITGVLLYCLLPSLLLTFFWYRYLEKPNTQLFGLHVESTKLPLETLMFIVCGILIGAYSHVLWDATSHSYGAFVENSEFWNQNIGPLPLFKWNQYVSGMLGLVLLTVWYLTCLTQNKTQPYRGSLKTGLMIYMTCIGFFVVLANWLNGLSTMAKFAVHSSIGFMVGIVVAAIIYSVIMVRYQGE